MRILVCFLVFMGFNLTLWAQSISLQTPKSVQVGEAFQLNIVVDGADLDQLELPDMKGFDIVGGPMRSSSVSIINGQVSKTASLSYELLAKSKGTFKLGPVSMKINGAMVQSNIASIEVGGEASIDPSVAGSDVFMRIETYPKQDAYYVGQQIMVKYVVYYNQSIQFNNFLSEPNFNHFFVQPIDLNNNERSSMQINGKNYSKAVISAMAIFPQKAGNWELGKLSCKFGVEDGMSGSGFFATRSYKPLVLNSNDLNLQIRQLPEGAPASFSGAVGQYSFRASADRQSIALNESLKLNLEIEGNGDHKLIQGPKLFLGSDLEVYEPNKLDEQTDYNQEYVFHKTGFQYFVVPQKQGDFRISPEFAYFDPVQEKYMTLHADSLSFQVVAASNTPLTQENTPQESTKTGWPSWVYGLMGAAGFGILGFLGFFFFGKTKDAQTKKEYRSSFAPKKAKAKKGLNEFPEISTDDPNFYRTLTNTIFKTVCQLYTKTAIQQTTPGMVEAVLENAGPAKSSELKEILLLCEEKVFYDNGHVEDRAALYSRTQEFFNSLRA